ncbi:hypothetical protein BJ508DRAFT_308464 [Ascobolus immersus RN42]|uniref:Uncharacterized protein n=1 Tax=Ascobolus immersus RN42 TaxID=1160509 RepID=A0A3N4HZT1_ASCIM|nr:hypothetical protein BJ508DRAFT_308464 [Ascobolus immersus RN42]
MSHSHRIHARTIVDLASRTAIIQSIRPILNSAWLHSLFEGRKVTGIVFLNGNHSGSDSTDFLSSDSLSTAFSRAFVTFKSALDIPAVLELDGLRILETRLLVKRATLAEILEVGVERFVTFCPQVMYLAPRPRELGIMRRPDSDEQLTISMAGRRFEREYTIIEEPHSISGSNTALSSPTGSIRSPPKSEENVARRRSRRQNSLGRIQRMIHKWKTDMLLKKRRLSLPFHGIHSYDLPKFGEIEVELTVPPKPDHPTVTLVKSQIVNHLERQAATLTASLHTPYLNTCKRHLFLYVDLVWGDFLVEYGFKVDMARWHVGAELEVEAAFDKIIEVAEGVLADIGEMENETTHLITLLKLGGIRARLRRRLGKLLEDSKSRPRLGTHKWLSYQQSCILPSASKHDICTSPQTKLSKQNASNNDSRTMSLITFPRAKWNSIHAEMNRPQAYFNPDVKFERIHILEVAAKKELVSSLGGVWQLGDGEGVNEIEAQFPRGGITNSTTLLILHESSFNRTFNLATNNASPLVHPSPSLTVEVNSNIAAFPEFPTASMENELYWQSSFAPDSVTGVQTPITFGPVESAVTRILAWMGVEKEDEEEVDGGVAGQPAGGDEWAEDVAVDWGVGGRPAGHF